jgi:5'-deoxynucleotidase YfbR-like HD superfamily hydrolase
MKQKITTAVDLDNKKIVYDGCMVTVSGIIVDLMNPDPDTLFIEDIAHGLAYNCRWNGHTKGFWSVAQHCCMMHDRAPYNDRLTYLFHDAEEAYWGDMIKPLKNIIREIHPEILDSMKLIRKAIYHKFSISPVTCETMIEDFNCLQWEFEHVIKNADADFWLPEKAKQEWLCRYHSAK